MAAATDFSTCASAIQNGVLTLDCLPNMLVYFTNGLLTLAGTFTGIYIIFAGFKWITSHGDEKELETAHQTFFYAIIGLLIVFLSFLIVNVIATVTGVTCINTFGFNSCINVPK